MTASLTGRSLATLTDLTSDELTSIIELAARVKKSRVPRGSIKVCSADAKVARTMIAPATKRRKSKIMSRLAVFLRRSRWTIH